MAADLEAVYAHHLARGLPEEEAAIRAEETVLASPEAVARLVEVHTGGPERWLHLLSGRLRNDLEPFLFVLAVLPMLALAVVVLLPQVASMASDPWLWLQLACAAAIAGMALRKAVQLFGRAPVELPVLRRGLTEIPFLGAMACMIGGLGAVVHLYALAILLGGYPAPPEEAAIAAAMEMGRHFALFGASILLAMAAGAVWLFLARRVAALERAESILLLGE